MRRLLRSIAAVLALLALVAMVPTCPCGPQPMSPGHDCCAPPTGVRAAAPHGCGDAVSLDLAPAAAAPALALPVVSALLVAAPSARLEPVGVVVVLAAASPPPLVLRI